jgi:hypothetical protein
MICGDLAGGAVGMCGPPLPAGSVCSAESFACLDGICLGQGSTSHCYNHCHNSACGPGESCQLFSFMSNGATQMEQFCNPTSPPDAGVRDSGVVFPDATTPDAGFVFPDATAPDAGFVFPDASDPDQGFAFPDASDPDQGFAYPDASAADASVVFADAADPDAGGALMDAGAADLGLATDALGLDGAPEGGDADAAEDAAEAQDVGSSPTGRVGGGASVRRSSSCACVASLRPEGLAPALLALALLLRGRGGRGR